PRSCCGKVTLPARLVVDSCICSLSVRTDECSCWRGGISHSGKHGGNTLIRELTRCIRPSIDTKNRDSISWATRREISNSTNMEFKCRNFTARDINTRAPTGDNQSYGGRGSSSNEAYD